MSNMQMVSILNNADMLKRHKVTPGSAGKSCSVSATCPEDDEAAVAHRELLLKPAEY